MPENLFFIAVVPPPSISKEVLALKEAMAVNYGSKHALKSPAHITLIPPFWWDIDLKTEFCNDLKMQMSFQQPFEIRLIDFGCFKPRVIFVNVKSNLMLANLQERLQDHLKKTYSLVSDRRSFRPHMTIAFKDLKPRSFYRAWEHFRKRKYGSSFVCSSIFLLMHEKGRWLVVEEFPFKMD